MLTAKFINLCDATYHNQAIELRASPPTLRVTLQAKMNQRGVATLDSYGRGYREHSFRRYCEVS